MTRKIVFCCALFTLVLSTAIAQEVPLAEKYRQQLEADRAQLFAMSKTERQQYLAEFFGHSEREHRRAFKEALGQVRQEWNVIEPRRRQIVEDEAQSERVVVAAGLVAGSNITYDTGTRAGGAGNASRMLGNRFDSALTTGGAAIGPVETSGSITQITFDMINTFFGSVVWSLYSNVVGTMADQVTSMARPGIMTGLNTLAVMSPTTANAYMNGTFLAGIWQFDPTMTGLAIDTGSTGGQGFHAISLNDGAVGTGLTSITNANAIFRVSGNVATPVELMDFSIEKAPTNEP